jgi:DNA-binding response OmpR family regulator
VEPSRSTILFVDDDVELRGMVREQLAEEGYQIDEADNGALAIERLEAQEYDLVLLDIVMPEKTGLDVLNFIRDKKLSCRVIMLTGVTGLATAIESLNLGASDYITKQYNIEYLLAAIRRVLSA